MSEEVKVSQLPETETINDDDILMIVQNNVNKKIKRKHVTDIKVSSTEPTTGEKVWFKSGKNLLDKNLILNGTSSIQYVPIKVNKNKDYTLSTNSGSSSVADVFLSTTNSGVSTANNGAIINSPRTINSGSNEYIFVGYRTDLSSYWFQLEQGSTATSYEAYVEKEIYIKNNNNAYEEFVRKASEEYSTSELKVGTWTNGRPLYRKVFKTTLPTPSTDGSDAVADLAHGISDIRRDAGTFIENAFFITSTGNSIPIPYMDETNTSNIRVALYGTDYIRIHNNRTAYGGLNVYIILKYLKTTD